MNNTSDPNASQPQNESQGAANPQSASQPGHCVLEPLCSAASDGAQRAKAAAEKAIPKVKAALAGTAYWLGYGVSFATVFSYTVLKEVAPDVLRAGCRAGAQAGRNTAEDLAAKLRPPPQAQEATSSAE